MGKTECETDFDKYWEFGDPGPIEDQREEIDDLRARRGDAKGLKAFEVTRKIHEIIRTDLSARGTFYIHVTGYYFFWKPTLVLLDAKDHEFRRLLMQYGITAVSDVAQIDITETTNLVFVVEDVDLTWNLFEVSVLPAVAQLQGG